MHVIKNVSPIQLPFKENERVNLKVFLMAETSFYCNLLFGVSQYGLSKDFTNPAARKKVIIKRSASMSLRNIIQLSHPNIAVSTSSSKVLEKQKNLKIF